MGNIRSGTFVITENQLHWLAGLLEGEGCFRIVKRGLQRTPQITINMTDRDVIERVAILLASGIVQCRRASERLQAQYAAQVGGGSAVALMRLLWPLMGQRRQAQIDRSMAAHSLRVPYGHKVFEIVPDAVPEPMRYWLAGYLEGEGYFTARTYPIKGREYVYPYIEVNSTDEDVIEQVQHAWRSLYGIEVNIISKQPGYPGSKRVYRVYCLNAAAASIMRDLGPLLGQRRRAKIAEILSERPGVREERAVYWISSFEYRVSSFEWDAALFRSFVVQTT